MLGRLDEEDGAFTVWVAGLVLVVLAVGGLSVDLWHVFAERRAVAGVAESVITAAASGLDEGALRSGAPPRLDPVRARGLAEANLAAQSRQPEVDLTVAPDGSAVTVIARSQVELTLLRLLVGDAEPLEIRVQAVSEPLRRGP